MQATIKLNIIIEPAEEGGVMAFIEEMPNVCTQGDSSVEVKENLMDALEMVLGVQRELSRKKGYHENAIREELELALHEAKGIPPTLEQKWMPTFAGRQPTFHFYQFERPCGTSCCCSKTYNRQ